MGESLNFPENYLLMSICLLLCLLGHRERGFHKDAALTLVSVLAAVLADEDVALHAPALTPRVLHLPVLVAARGAVADGEHSVVEARAARSRQHTRAVKLERRLIGLDGDRHGPFGHGRLERCHRVRGHIRVRADRIVFGAARARLARAIARSVRVLALRAESARSLHVLERVVHQPAVAALVAVRSAAVDELLL